MRSLVFFYLLFLLLGRAKSEWKSSKNRSSSRSFLVLLQFNSIHSINTRKEKKAKVSKTLFPANKAKETTQRERERVQQRERENAEREYIREREHQKEEKSIIMLATSSSGSISGVGAMRVVARGSGRRAMMRTHASK